MPELPEVETTLRGLQPHLMDRTPLSVRVRQPRLRWPVDEQGLAQWCGVPIEAVHRRSKWLVLESAKGFVLIHLGMSGSLRVLPAGTPAQKHDHIDLLLDDDRLLRYTDPRRFGAWLVGQGDWRTHPRLQALGPEPLSDTFSIEHLAEQCRKSRRAIKTFIMDSRIVVGVGNIYANEALFKAGIHPARPARTLSVNEVARLHGAIVRVLHQAIAAGGTTLQDFTRPDGRPGYFSQALAVYDKVGEPCPRCGRASIERITLGQRSAFFCPHCQV